MRKYLYFIFLLAGFSVSTSYGQDLIVTNVGDSIACKIVRETPTIVQFTYAKYNQNLVREFGKDRVSSIVMGFYDQIKNAAPAVQESTNTPIVNTSVVKTLVAEPETKNTANLDSTQWPRWQFGVNGGYGYRLFRARKEATPYELKYIDKIKTGFSFGTDLFYFPWKSVGFGVKYNMYRSKAERDIRTADDITLQFLGASVAHRKIFTNQKTAIISAFWAGYQPYKNVARHLGQSYTMKANTMGWGISVGIDHKITPKLALSLTGNCFMGNIYKFKRDSKGQVENVKLPYDAFEDLARADITLGLKFLK